MILKFLIKRFIIYLIFIGTAYYFNLNKPYSNFIKNCGNIFINEIKGKAKIIFKPIDPKRKQLKITLQGIKIRYSKNFYPNTWLVGFLPLAFTISLMLPLKLNKLSIKFAKLFLSIILIITYTLICLKLKSIYYYNVLLKEINHFENSWYTQMIEFVNHAFIDQIVPTLTAPVFIWLMLCSKESIPNIK